MFVIIFLYLCKRNSNLIYALHRRNETFSHFSHISDIFICQLWREALLLPWAAHGSRCACVLLCYILITKWFDSRDQTPVEPGVCLALSLSVSFLLANLYDLVELNIFLHCADKHLFYLATGKYLTRLQKWLPLRLISIKSMKSRSTVWSVVFNLA